MKKFIKKIISVLLALTVILGSLPMGMTEVHAFAGTWADFAGSGFAGGDGSQANPYQIATAEQLAYLAKQVNNGTTYSSKYFKLTTNIDVSAHVWEPIGYLSTSPANDTFFQGHFDGNGYYVKDVHFGSGVTGPNQDYVHGGLFGQTNGATIQNLGVNTTSSSYSGMSLEGKNSVWLGALVGLAESTTITNCYSTGDKAVTIGHNATSAGAGTYKPAVGGLVGVASGSTIDRCYSDVKVAIGYYADAGGLVGRISSTTVKNSYSVAPVGSTAERGIVVNPDMVVGSEVPYIGGLVGSCFTYGKIINCYANRNIYNVNGSTSPNFAMRIGGLVGYQDVWATGIENCYAAGSIALTNTSADAKRSALVGENVSKIYNSYCVYGDAPIGVDSAPAKSDVVQLTDAEMKGGAASIQYYTSYTDDSTKTLGGTVASVIDALNLGRAATGIACYGWKADSTSSNNGYPVFDTGSASTISLKNKTVQYNGVAVAYTSADVASLSGSGGNVSYKYYSDAACNTEIAAPINAGTYYVKATVAADSLYGSAVSAATTLTINKAALTITPDSGQQKAAGVAEPVLTYNYSGNISGETPAFSGTLSRAVGEAAGTYAISQGTLAITDNGAFLANNYTLTVDSTKVFTIAMVPVTDITGIPTEMTAGTLLTLSGAVDPVNATNKTISWSIKIDGGTSATISGNTLSAANAGTVTVTATITDGTAVGTNYKKDFTIAVSVPFISVTDITGIPTAMTAGTPLTLSGAVAPAGATNQTIVWSVKDAGTTGATISGNTLSAANAGTVTVTATITDGTAVGTNYKKDFTIAVSVPFISV
ncbi:GLUG motif-containing protein, partial [Sinanaerobacter chloroacetimidivorans]